MNIVTIENFFKKAGVPLSEEEKDFLQEVGRGVLDEKEIIYKLYTMKKQQVIVDKLIKSNENLAKSQTFFSWAMIGLTAALVIVGFLQVFCSGK